MQPIQMLNQDNWLDELKQLTKTVKPVLKQEPACGILISSLAQRIELIYMYLEHIVIQEANFFFTFWKSEFTARSMRVTTYRIAFIRSHCK